MSKTRKIIVPGAVAARITLGAAAIASASGGSPAQATDDTLVEDTTVDTVTTESEAPETEVADTDEAVDGVDHQFEGEETGNNGVGVADADDSNVGNEAEGRPEQRRLSSSPLLLTGDRSPEGSRAPVGQCA